VLEVESHTQNSLGGIRDLCHVASSPSNSALSAYCRTFTHSKLHPNLYPSSDRCTGTLYSPCIYIMGVCLCVCLNGLIKYAHKKNCFRLLRPQDVEAVWNATICQSRGRNVPKDLNFHTHTFFFIDSFKILYKALSMNIVRKILVAAILIQNKPHFT